jgi:hypothetical protein
MYLSDHSKNLISAEEKVAELIKQRDQLRAELSAAKLLLNEETDCAEAVEAAIVRQYARAERAEAELGKLEELHGCSQGMVVHWCAHAAERSQGLDQARAELATWHSLRLWGTTPEIVHEFIKGQQARIHAAQDIEAELAADRARLDWLRDNVEEIYSNEYGIVYLCGDNIRAGIDAAMKEGAK